jgi:hypothetical protein
MRFRLFVLAVVLSLALVQSVQAAVIHYGGPVQHRGTGHGAVLTLLVLQEKGPNGAGQFGSVLFDGQQDVKGGHATPQSRTYTSGELASKGVSAGHFHIVLNLNQPGARPAITLGDFIIRFQDPTGQTLFDAQFDVAANPDAAVLSPVGLGTGQAGYLFWVDFSTSEAELFFSESANRVGMIVPVASAMVGATAGPESFYISIPEPASGLLLLGGGTGMLLKRHRRTRCC